MLVQADAVTGASPGYGIYWISCHRMGCVESDFSYNLLYISTRKDIIRIMDRINYLRFHIWHDLPDNRMDLSDY